MALDTLLDRLEREAGTSGTSSVPADVPPNPLQTLGGTSGTSGTAEKAKGQGVAARSWRFHFHDRDPLAVVYGSPTSHAQALADEPTAIAAEPIPEQSTGTRRTPTEAERAELLALLEAIYADDTDQDRQEAIAAALSDPDGALLCYRAICLERGQVVAPPAPPAAPAPPACRRCRHRATPGRADPGYCDRRTELAPAYGDDHPLHQLPGDGGASCTRFEAWP